MSYIKLDGVAALVLSPPLCKIEPFAIYILGIALTLKPIMQFLGVYKNKPAAQAAGADPSR